MKALRLIVFGTLTCLPLPSFSISLADAERLLDEHSPALAAARLEISGSQGDLITASRRPVAELDIATGKFSSREGLGSGPFHDKRLDSTASVGWTWERGGKRRLRQEHAGALLNAASLDLLDTARTQRLGLREHYYGLKAAQEVLAAAEDNRQLSRQALDATELRIRAGDAPAIEYNRLLIEDLKLDGAVRDSRQALLDAQHALALLIHYPADVESLFAADPWPAPVLADADFEHFDSTLVLSQRPDQRAASARVQAADNARQMARSLRKRDLGLAVAAEREPTDVAGLTWGVSISIPLNGNNHYQGEWVRAEADYRLRVLEQTQLGLEADAELKRLRRAWQDSGERLRLSLEQVAPAAKSMREGMELAYRRGGASLTDLLDARRAAREAEADLIDTQFEHALAQARWQSALQTDLTTGIHP